MKDESVKFVFAFVKGKAIGYHFLEGSDRFEAFGNEREYFPFVFGRGSAKDTAEAKNLLREWLDYCGFPGTAIHEDDVEPDGLKVYYPKPTMKSKWAPEEVGGILEEEGVKAQGKVVENEWITLFGETIEGDMDEREDRLWCGGTWIVLERRIGSQWITPLLSSHTEQDIREMVQGWRKNRAAKKKIQEDLQERKEKE
ncbi:hypothetical protein [uncultured Fretibacterium sp.]|uniref:hypothetical protein n=1 Tax=uncultured Fretibacterium sp. TaxID=1678694 RepID=UPI00262296A6|nr:hypothetical protein [uncultured Fretibacterium sp.]